MKKEIIKIEKVLLKQLFKDWLDTYQAINTRRWEGLSVYEADLLLEALWKDFYENYLLGKIEFK